MVSGETHSQLTGSHNEPGAQGSSGGEHLDTHKHTKTFSKCFDVRKKVTHKYLKNAHHAHSQVICRSSSYDGVERPLGEAFTCSVVNEGYHDGRRLVCPV